MLELNLGWNSLRAKGGAALAEGLKGNSVLNKVDIGWNGLGDEGAKAVGEMLGSNAALTHLDVSHNRINLDGALALAEGIRNNTALLSLELGFNPMGICAELPRAISISEEEGGAISGSLQNKMKGVREVVEAIKANTNLETVGLTNVQSGGSYSRGRASRFDPKSPDGHYLLDLLQPWDRFLVEVLHERMTAEVGESWVNSTIVHHGTTTAVPLELPKEGGAWEIPEKGVIEFDYVTWKRGLEASFRLDLSNPCDMFLAEQLLRRTGTSGADNGGESCRECQLDGAPYEQSDGALPDKGTLRFTYISTKPQDEILFPLKLDLSVPNDKVMCLRLWERALTTPTDAWKSAILGAAPIELTTWQYPEVPGAGMLQLEYAVRLAIKPHDRGVYFSAPMENGAFKRLADTLASEARSGRTLAPAHRPAHRTHGVPMPGRARATYTCTGTCTCTCTCTGTCMQALSDFDKVNLIKQASLRNYFTSHQVKSLLDVVSYRKGKLEVAVRIACRGSLEQGLLRTYAHVHVQSACARCACACACACLCKVHVHMHACASAPCIFLSEGGRDAAPAHRRSSQLCQRAQLAQLRSRPTGRARHVHQRQECQSQKVTVAQGLKPHCHVGRGTLLRSGELCRWRRALNRVFASN